MFEDIIQKQPEEISVLPKCTHIGRNHHCEYFIPKQNVPYKLPVCDFLGGLTESCYLDKFDI